jgi:hypothetical protein
LNDPFFGDYSVQSNVVGRGNEPIDLLERISETDQAWRMPHRAQESKSKRTVVVPASHAEADTTRIEPHQRQEHDIEPPRTDRD